MIAMIARDRTAMAAIPAMPAIISRYTPASQMPKPLDSATLARELEEFLGLSRNAIVLEDGRQIFDLRSARYSVSGEHGKALLHFWSQERNLVRRVLECERRGGTLRLAAQRFGQTKPGKLEIVLAGDARSPAARKSARTAYDALLQQVLEREYPNATVEPRASGSNALDPTPSVRWKNSSIPSPVIKLAVTVPPFFSCTGFKPS